MDAIREWAADNTYVDAGDPVYSNFFPEVTRLWARHFYWDDSNLASPVPLASPDSNAAVTSVATTLDFLYLFSAGAAGDDADGEMYGASDFDHLRQDDLPNVYMWVFADRATLLPGEHTEAKVNIPSIIGTVDDIKGGMNMSYWEWDTKSKDASGKPYHPWNAPGLQYPIQSGVAAGSYPWEDQTHHFAAYFYLGACHGDADTGLMGNTWPPFANLKYALENTGDYPGPVGPAPAAVPANQEDYFLGVVAADLGSQYRGSSGLMANRISGELTVSYQTARASNGRTVDP